MQNAEKYPEYQLTEKIIGIAFKVFNDLRYGYKEKAYQKAFEALLKESKLSYKREKYGLLKYHRVILERYFLDFLVEEKVAVELKVKSDIYGKDVGQLLNYIKSENIPVGLLIVFTKDGVKIKRLANTIN